MLNISVRRCGVVDAEHNFMQAIVDSRQVLRRAKVRELQINLGKLCNQACEHCHVEAGPKRTEIMARDTVDRILTWARQQGIKQVDLTGGAPELNPHFRYMVDAIMAMGASVTSRCNLTVLFEPHQEDLARWYAERRVKLVCSLPCYSEKNVDAQRGKGVFGKSIKALQMLNALGYGKRDDMPLDLVYNPGGPFLPPPQASLEAEYKQRLADDFGISFTHLFTLTNLPVHRFAHYLKRTGQYDDYLQLLHASFNPDTVDGLMCRHIISVDWLGRVYDCDFNQMLEMPLAASEARYLWDIDGAALEQGGIATGAHCFGCTAGAGSSCGGALLSGEDSASQ